MNVQTYSQYKTLGLGLMKLRDPIGPNLKGLGGPSIRPYV